MQLLGIFKPARLLDDTQSQKAGIEIDIRLHFSGDEGDVVDAACHGRCLPDSELVSEIEQMTRLAYGAPQLRIVNARKRKRSGIVGS